ncbi:MAG: class I SAM-dependent methyltransferase [Pararhodobacter sp.]
MHKDLRINFPPKFARRWTEENGGAAHILAILEAQRAPQAAFIERMAGFTTAFLSVPWDTPDPTAPRWKQNWFPSLDGMSSYTVVAANQPRRLIEIGSGNSTKFFAKARNEHSPATTITSIDPQPREEIDAICETIHRCGLEDVDLGIFDELVPGDVLFFDGSHRSFQNSDVTVFFLEVLPRLAEGVIVGLHDIFWPVDYPQDWLDRYYNEQYLLACYMLPYGKHFPLIFSSAHATRHMRDKLNEAFSPETRAALPALRGGCFWFEKRSISAPPAQITEA